MDTFTRALNQGVDPDLLMRCVIRQGIDIVRNEKRRAMGYTIYSGLNPLWVIRISEQNQPAAGKDYWMQCQIGITVLASEWLRSCFPKPKALS